ncbi:MAG: glycosyltransferase family 4 protein [Erythrobacter sp.]|uniref:glycosyltransferase family 4 protein n=1 Tax=Erythrobacter sp. TaxID=1042 RepID=UPI00260DEF36|nr:glycosyltransferase family 4 protein [Erythrobacter sp.]MDJ0977086.1 glycosyltransferase family 4 protein [Erythrobacter sp.]
MNGAKSGGPLRILHCHSTFAAGGKERRSVALMNAFGQGAEHTIVSGDPDELGARALLDQRVVARFPDDFPSLSGRPTPGRLVTIARALEGFDLILTYNWGAMDVVMAHTMFAQPFNLAPLIHHEDGFNEDEAEHLKASRNWYRRVALWRTGDLVVPSRALETVALTRWKQPRERITCLPNGIDTAAFARKPDPQALRVVKREGERWIGTIAGLRPVKQLPVLVEAMKDLPDNWHLIILGDGPERGPIREAATRHEVDHRVHTPGAIDDPSRVIGLFDIFALSSRSEQFPLCVVEAMAAGLPVAAPAVGDIAAMVSQENSEYITPRGDTGALARALEELAGDPEGRAEIGAANRDKARDRYDEARMIERYRALYSKAAGRAL